MSELKILLATFWKHPVIGGSAMYIDQLKQGLERKGHEVDILAKHPSLNRYYLVNTNKFVEINNIQKVVSRVISHSFSKRDSFYKSNEMNYYCFELAASYLNLENYDLIHTQDIFSTRLLSRVKPKKTPLVASIHGCIATEYLFQKRNPSIKKQAINNRNDMEWSYIHWQEYIGAASSDITIVATKWLKDLLINDFGVEDNQLTIIPYALDINQFTKSMEETPPVLAPPGKTVIVCPARLAFIKGHNTLLDAFAKLKKQRTDWVCWLVGDGNLQTELVTKARKLNLLQNVRFLGAQKNVPAILKQADICVLSSLQESFPYAVMEAHIAGVPVVATDAGGLPEAVAHGHTGFISPIGNSEILYQNIKNLLDNTELRNTMASNAQIRGRVKWDLETMISKTLAIYEKVLKRKGGENL
ncbi:glycosyltransferase family 4 protein [Neobacillus sp. NPDC093182]|uniref:glycosyltransferase family 4 protein n=1 Tax=Neobacillus sp. NPDC093182 TaxID=3364297 RepID=UPI00382BBB3F